jgi:capsular polysaccharide biosynthesis protein
LVSATAIVHNALVFLGDTVVSNNRLLDIDDAANPSHDFVAGRHFDVVGTHLNLKEAVVRIPARPDSISGSAILLSTRADINWFHWLIETLPKLFIADSSIDPGVPLLISSRIPPSAKESLALLSQRQVIEFDDMKGVTLDELHIVSPVIFNPDTLNMWLSENSNQLNKDAITALRTTVLERLLPAENDSLYPDKLFVARRTGARGLVNGLSIRRMLRRRGFVSFEPETKSFADQVLAFNKARTIVMVGGASMANLIFCQNGAKVIFLSSTLVLPNRLVSVLADIASATVARVAGPVVGGMFRQSLLEKIHSHYRIPISELNQSLLTLSPEKG